jgi:hypothetical protein
MAAVSLAIGNMGTRPADLGSQPLGLVAFNDSANTSSWSPYVDQTHGHDSQMASSQGRRTLATPGDSFSALAKVTGSDFGRSHTTINHDAEPLFAPLFSDCLELI